MRDPQKSGEEYSGGVQEAYAVIYAPSRKRKRFPENCVRLVSNEKTALDSEDAVQKLFAAKVMGPCRSSEGLRVFYLLHWLQED